MTSGLQPGSLTIVGARPAVGKSAFALGIAAHVAIELRRPVLFVSLEMPHDELLARLVSLLGKVDSTRLRSATLSEPDWARIGKAHTRLAGAPLVLDDDSMATVGAIRARARRLRARYKDLALVVVDYLQLLGTPSGARVENRQLVVDENTRMLKLLARDLAVPVLATSQVSRAVEARADKRPMLSDLRESGAIESHSDVVAALYRDELYNPASSDRGMAEVNVLKHRNGPTGCVRLAFLGAYTMFAERGTSLTRSPSAGVPASTPASRCLVAVNPCRGRAVRVPRFLVEAARSPRVRRGRGGGRGRPRGAGSRRGTAPCTRRSRVPPDG